MIRGKERSEKKKLGGHQLFEHLQHTQVIAGFVYKKEGVCQ